MLVRIFIGLGFVFLGLLIRIFTTKGFLRTFSGLGIGNKSCGQAVVLCSSKVQPPGHHAAWKVLENMYM